MSRTLHVNPRNFKEPFFLIKPVVNKINGIDQIVSYKTIMFFGSIRNKFISRNESHNLPFIPTLSIKIIKPEIVFNKGDSIRYRGENYVINSIEYDLYSRNEMIINCEYQTEIGEGSFSV